MEDKMKASRFMLFGAFLLVIFVLLTIGCQNSADKTELQKFKSAIKIQEQNKEIVRQIVKAIDDGNIDKLRDLLSDDFSLYPPRAVQSWKKEDLFKARNAHFEAFPDWIHKIEDLVAEGDKVVVKLTQYGTHKAKYKGIEPTGAYVTVPAISIMRIVNGKVKDWWVLEDNLGLMMQLGMELKSK
jgi:predicted ester cyclase